MGTYTPMLNEHHCPICGKEFYPTACWVYREKRENDGVTYYCSYKCFSHRNDGKKEKQRKRKLKQIEQLTTDGVVVNTFESAAEAGYSVDGCENAIRDAIRMHKKYKKHLWRYKTDGLSEV